MKSLPEELAYRISFTSQNPFFYLINGIWNKKNFEKLLQQNYTFPSVLKRLVRSGENKILKQLCLEYEEELNYLPSFLQQDIQQLLQELSFPLSNSLDNSYNNHQNQKSQPQQLQHNRKRKLSENYIPSLKIIQVETVFQKGLLWVIRNQLQTGEYTYIKEENENEDGENGRAMTHYLEGIRQRFEEIKNQIADANGCIPSATEKSENPEYCFTYLYALMSSLNFKDTKWNHELLMNYHPSFIKIKMTEEVLNLFNYLNNTFECCKGEMLKPTYFTLKEMYEETCHHRIKSQGYMDFIFDHTEYEPLILDTLNNIPITTWKVLHFSHNDELMNVDDTTEDYINNNDDSSAIPSSLLPSESLLPPDQHNILYILSHNFFLGMYPSCHLLYLYDKYIEAVLQFYDEDNNQIFKYYSGISSNPDESLKGFFYYTSLILLLRSSSVRCLFVNPEHEIKIQQEKARSRRRQIHPSFLSTLGQPNRKLIFVSNPLSARSINIEQLLPYLNSTSSSSTSPSSSPIPKDNPKDKEEKEEKVPSSSSTTINSLSSTSNTNSNINDANNIRESEESIDDIVSKKFRIQIPSTEEPISYIKTPDQTQTFLRSSSLPTPSSSLSVDNNKSKIAISSSSSLPLPNCKFVPIPIQKPKVMVEIKNNILSFNSQVNEWHIRRRHSLLTETLDSTIISSSEEKENENKITTKSMEMMNESKEKDIKKTEEELYSETENDTNNDNNKVMNTHISNSPSNDINVSSTSLSASSTSTSPSLSLSTPELYISAAKNSKLISNAYDEDWYIRRCLPNKKNKGYWTAKIYLY